VLHITGSGSKLQYLPLPEDDPRLRRPDINLAREQLDWTPTVELDAGLARTIAYFAGLST
jgi:UDP-glucuronate decarboxylase